MAKTNRIQFTDGHFAYNPTYSPQDIMADAPANAAPAKQVTTGQAQKNSVTAGPVGQAAKSYASQQLKDSLTSGFKGAPTQDNPVNPETYQYQGQYGNTWRPTVYNQNALNSYDKGLQAARDWDAKSSLSPGFKQRIYQIINGNRPEAQLTPYVPNAAQQYQMTDPKDGSTMQNPNTNPELALQWNMKKLKEMYPDWSDAQLQYFANQPYNWQAAQAFTNAGIWEPTEQSRAWSAYLQEKARLEAEAAAQAAAAAQYSGGGDDGGYDDGGGDYSGGDDSGSYDDGGSGDGGGDNSDYQFVVASDPRYDLTGNNLYDWTAP